MIPCVSIFSFVCYAFLVHGTAGRTLPFPAAPVVTAEAQHLPLSAQHNEASPWDTAKASAEYAEAAASYAALKASLEAAAMATDTSATTIATAVVKERASSGVAHQAATSTQDDDRPPFTYDHSLNFVLAVPKYKLLFCYVPKNACSQFNGLVNELNGLPPNGVPWFGSSALRHFGWSKKRLVESLRSEQWYKAVFLRDPLERVLSAYLSKCLPRADGSVEDWGEHCLGYERAVRDGEMPKFEEFIQNLAGMDATDAGLLDAHFRQQGDFCGGLNVSEYDFIGTFEKPLTGQVRSLLKAVGASASADLAEKYFPPNEAETAQENRLTSASTPNVFNSHYTNARVLSTSLEIYRKDYQRFPVLRQRHKANNICITCLYALDFEKRRSLDWIAYHNLMGVNCFLLFLDRERSNMEDPEVKKVYEHMLASPMVTLLDAATDGDRIPSKSVMKDLVTIFGVQYLMTLDGDEFAVLNDNYPAADDVENMPVLTERIADGNSNMMGLHMSPDLARAFGHKEAPMESASLVGKRSATKLKLAQPPSLRPFLEEHVASRGALGVYMHRWDYGTSGFVNPPSLIASPEFSVFTERVGGAIRRNPGDRHGKVVLNMVSGVQYIGVHTWTVPQDGGAMLLPNGTVFGCKPECLCGELCRGQHQLASCDGQCIPQTEQTLFINHYVTGSLEECYAKKQRSVWDRRSLYECRRLHPGTEEYQAQAARTGFSRDDVLAKYASAVRMRRVELFLAH